MHTTHAAGVAFPIAKGVYVFDPAVVFQDKKGGVQVKPNLRAPQAASTCLCPVREDEGKGGMYLPCFRKFKTAIVYNSPEKYGGNDGVGCTKTPAARSLYKLP